MSGHFRFRPVGLRLAVPLLLGASLALPATATAAVSKTYTFNGVEVWATSTVGTFAGDAWGSKGDYAAWRASIQHTVQTQPQGSITGGYAELFTSDATRIHGDFSGGTLVLTSTGVGSCGTLTHEVNGSLINVIRSDSSRVGSGSFVGSLFHYRVSILGACLIYSASANGTISLHFYGNG